MSTLWVRHAPSSAAVARRSVHTAFRRAGMPDDDAFDASLIANELVANAVRHATALPSGHLAVEWVLDSASYTVSVTDGGSSSEVTPRETDPHDISGRGLMIVAALAQDWGVSSTTSERGTGTTTVWARGKFASADSLNRRGLQTTS
ncbi:MAG: ATP-binding protein [Jatrophihabitantaceae bacterium]